MRRPSPLQIALGVSVGLHLALLALRFGAPETFNRVFQDTPLEVVLVNARSNEKPSQAQALAQASLAGGGEAASGRATSPLPYSAITNAGDSADEARRQIDSLMERQEQLLAQIRKEIAALPVPDPRASADTPDRAQQEERRRQLVKLLAEIERRVNEENARPRKRYISPATREVAYALYYDHLRRRIEDRGTQYFPEAGGTKLYGELTMVVTVHHDGRVVSTEIVRSSGNKQLDRRAEAIARGAGPFGAFDAQMRREVDQIVIVSRFKFTRDETLEAHVR
ncbi:TonB family protein [Xylophilus sp. GOD-11R]|uniref:energy transducer TonB n=1 Tax=Xylophilus sp. GOD-11R TaxID=3089814 RepID=UPI00298C3373|nr:TonB family protein [Xylophilus sp. GOD-11R]WPB56181.1 TonB family protein [Xylophilus sp. GOD-11R]